MPASRRTKADARDGMAMSSFQDSPASSFYKDRPFNEEDEFVDEGKQDNRALLNGQFLVQPRVASRRWRWMAFLLSMTTLVALAFLVAAGYDMLPEKIPNPLTSAGIKWGIGPKPGVTDNLLPPNPTYPADYADPPEPQDDNAVDAGDDSTESAQNDPHTSITKGIVMASYKKQTVGWIQNLNRYTKGWKVYRYVADDPDTNFLQVPTQYGREAAAYLTFIIDYYHKLPDFAVFVHGHDRAWHQPEHTIDKLMALNLTALNEEGYVNLRCAMSPGCTESSKFYFNPRNRSDTRPGMLIEEGFWQHHMAPEFGELPPVFGRRCCATFAVTKQAIQQRSLEFWKSLRQPLLGTLDDMKHVWGPNVDTYRLGSLYEQVWHILFGKPADYCPSTETCKTVHFQNLIECDGETTSFKDNKDNWNQIACQNPLRHAIDEGSPLDEIVPDDEVRFPELLDNGSSDTIDNGSPDSTNTDSSDSTTSS